MRVVKALASLIGLLLVIVGVPVLLVRLVGWPGPDHLPTFGELRRQVVQRDFGTSFIIGLLAVVGWVLWIQVVWATLWELIVNLRRVRVNVRPRSAPLVMAPVGRVVASAVMSVMTLFVPAQSAGIALAAGPLQVSHAAVVATHVDGAETTVASPHVVRADPDPDRASTLDARPTWTVRTGDTLWDIAEQTLGDGSRVDDIMTLNPQVQSASLLYPGVSLELPEDAVVPNDRVEIAASDTSATITVERGDTLWDIADERLGDPTRWPEIFDANRDQVMTDGATFDNPDLIQPGWVLTVGPNVAEAVEPAPATETPVEVPPAKEVAGEGTATDDATDEATTDEATTDDATADDATADKGSDADELAEPDGSAAPVSEWLLPPPKPVTFDPPSTTDKPAEPTTDEAEPTPDTRPPVPSTAGRSVAEASTPDASPLRSPSVVRTIGGGAFAFAALATLEVLRRRRRASRPRELRDQRHVTGEMALRAEAAAANVDIARRVQRWVRERLATDGSMSVLRVVVEDDGSVVVRWRDATGVVHDQSVSLQDLPAEQEIDEVPVMPALVSVGTTGYREVFVDLEALGSVTLRGPDELASGFVRGIGGQLAATNAECFSDRPFASFDDSPAPVRVDMQRVRGERAGLWAAMATGDVTSSVGARASGWPYEEIMPVVVLAADGVGDADLLEAAQPGRGVVVVTTSPVGGVEWCLNDSGGLVLEDGLVVERPALIDEAASAIVGELVADELHLNESLTTGPEVVAPITAAAKPFVPLQWRYMVRLMRAEIDVVDATGSPISFVSESNRNGRRAPELLAFLYFRGRTCSAADINEALWFDGRPVSASTVTSLVSRTRTALDTEALITDDGGWRLDSDQFVTDVELLAHVAEQVRTNPGDLDLLAESLEMIDDVPMRTSGSYNWASAHRYLHEVGTVISEAVQLAGRLALQRGEIDLARRVYQLGLKANPIDEASYQLAFEVEAASNDFDAIRRLYASLEVQLRSGLNESPHPTTTELYNSVMSRSRQSA